MKTSSSQFDALISFMEQFGDLSKPSRSARGRADHINKWIELTDLLNSDRTGDYKSLEKWKKVWSDCKNNTKRKAARIAASGTDGCPIMRGKLTDMEQRVLAIVGLHAETGLLQSSVDEGVYVERNPLERIELVETTAPVNYIANKPIKEDIESWEQPGQFSCPATPQNQQDEATEETTQNSAFQESDHSPSRQTPPRPRRRFRKVPHRCLGTHIDQEWRKFKINQHRDWVEVKKEQMRVRKMELEIQKGWLNLCHEALSALKDFTKQ